MRIVNLLIVFLCLIASDCFAQEQEFDREVMAYFEGNGTAAQYEGAYDELLKMLRKRFPKTAENKEGWQYLDTNKGKAVSDIKQLLVPIYKQLFSQEEIREMAAFYESSAGKQLRKDSTQMSDEQKEMVNEFYGSALGKKIMKKQSILSQEISKISESWSRDLYETALSLLK